MNTLTWIEQFSQARLGMSLVIEGFGTVYATEAMAGAFSGAAAPFNQWSDPTPGLDIVGTIGESIELYAQDLETTSLDFRVVDPTGGILQLFRSAYALGHKTYLTSSVVAGSTATWNVKSTTGFAASGTLYCGDEAITYSAKGGGGITFTGITRAVYGVNLTDSGARFSPSHTIGNNVTTSAVTAPQVTDYPRTWYGRFCHLLLHVRDPLTGLFNLASEATRLWSGRIQSYHDEASAGVVITASSAHNALKRAVGAEQWSGRLPEGVSLDSNSDYIAAINSVIGSTTAYTATAHLGFDGVVSHAEAAGVIQEQFETWRAAVDTRAGDLWSITLVDPGDGGGLRYRIQLEANSTDVPSGSTVAFDMSARLLDLMGWPAGSAGQAYQVGGDVVHRLRLQRVSDELWHVIAPAPPIVYNQVGQLQQNTPLRVDNDSEQGTFVTQTVSDLDQTFNADNTNGVVAFEGGPFDTQVYSVKYTSGSPHSTVIIYARLDTDTGQFVNAGQAEHVDTGYVRLGAATSPPKLRQVWFEHGPAGQVLLKSLLSTGGASGYNHADYDVRTAPGHGASVPASLIDIPSWEDLDDVKLRLLVTEPRPFFELLESVLQCSNRFVVWKPSSASTPYKLAIVRPTLDNTTKLVWQLTESNKASSPDRTTVQVAADGIINRVIVRHGYGLRGDKAQAKTWVIEDVASQSDYGRRRTVELEAEGITNVEEIAPQAIAPALAYCSRPLAVATRSYNASLIRMAPGDAVSVADNFIIDPTTGTRGGVIYGWVLSTEFDLHTGKGQAKIVFLPEKLPRVHKWAPSARVDETAGNAGYNAGTKTLTLKSHEFSNAADATDATRFANLDEVHIYALDEASPLEWYDRINGGPGANSIVLTTGLAGWDTSKIYVIEYADVTNVLAAARNNHAFIADDADLTTGVANGTPYDWGQGPVLNIAPAAIDYSKGAFEPWTNHADKGEPMSIHKQRMLVDAANNAVAYKTRGVYINQRLQTSQGTTGTTPKLIYCAWIPIYGTQARGLVARLRGRCSSGTATFVIRSSPTRPKGQAFTGFTFPSGSTSASFNTASTSFTWSGELDLACSASPGPTESGLLGTWITVESFGSGGGVDSLLVGIFVAEGEL